MSVVIVASISELKRTVNAYIPFVIVSNVSGTPALYKWDSASSLSESNPDVLQCANVDPGRYIRLMFLSPTASTGIDDTAPSMTRLQLVQSSGTTRNSVHLIDGAGFNKYAWKNIGDTTSSSSATIIVDAGNVRWYVMSIRTYLDNLLNNYSPFPE